MKTPTPLAWEFKNGCIRCTSHVPMSNGYVYTYRESNFSSVPRQILKRRLGAIPYEIVCRHTCDNSWCINPAHIISGTRTENAQDRNDRGRNLKGENHPLVKLNLKQVEEIRQSSEAGLKLSSFYGVSPSRISMIRNGKSWK